MKLEFPQLFIFSFVFYQSFSCYSTNPDSKNPQENETTGQSLFLFIYNLKRNEISEEWSVEFRRNYAIVKPNMNKSSETTGQHNNVTIFNSHGEGHLVKVNYHPLVISSKEMLASERIRIPLPCTSERIRFPFDILMCKFYICTHGSTTIVKGNIKRENWTSSDFHVLKEEVTTEKSIGFEEPFACVKIEVELGRETSQYFNRVFIPTTAGILLAWLSLFLDPLNASTPRALILCSSLMICFTSAFASPVFHHFSQTSLDRWVTVCEVFLLVAVFEFIMVNRIAQTEIREEDSREINFPLERTQFPRGKTNNCHPMFSLIHKKWHLVIDILFRINFALAFLVFILRYYFMYVC